MKIFHHIEIIIMLIITSWFWWRSTKMFHEGALQCSILFTMRSMKIFHHIEIIIMLIITSWFWWRSTKMFHEGALQCSILFQFFTQGFLFF
jgi:hypothetical protein